MRRVVPVVYREWCPVICKIRVAWNKIRFPLQAKGEGYKGTFVAMMSSKTEESVMGYYCQ